MVRVGGDGRVLSARIAGPPHTSSQEGCADHLEFAAHREHILLAEVYGYHPHNNNNAHLYEGVPD